jgi:hypothetical protein
MICRICNSHTRILFREKVLNKYEANYFQCNNCGYLFTEEPYWLSEAYNSAINISDTGIIFRNTQFSKICSVIIDVYFNRNEKFLDYAGGYGIFTRMMRDIGFDFYWTDKYCENLLARGFEYEENKNNNFEAITAFEVFEHFADPVSEFETILKYGKNIIFSTELLPNPVPKPVDWWYYGFSHGQHVSFYTRESLSLLGKKHGLNFYSMKGIHIFTEKKLNEGILRFLKKASLIFLFDLMRIRYKSKTFQDHLLVQEKFKTHQ